jgi:ABC-type lipoprotein release transport system permease subunit
VLFSIAWRNLWRNGRRTATAVAAVGGGVAVMLIVFAMINGMTDRMLEAVTGSFVGHAQLHREGFRGRRTPSLTVSDADRVLAAVRATGGVEAAAGRVFGVAQASLVRGGDDEVRGGGGLEVATPVVALLGVEPGQERRVTDLAERVVAGRWLEGGAEMVIGEGVARRTGARLGDALLPTAVDVDGALRGPWAVSDEVPRVVGIVRTGMEELDERGVLVGRGYLSRLLHLEGQVHEVAIRARRQAPLGELVGAVRRSVAEARATAGRVERLPATRLLEVAAGEPGAGGRTLGLRLVGVAPGPEGGEARGAGLAAGRYIERTEELILSAAAARELGSRPGARVTVAVPVECGDEVPAQECLPSEETFLVAGVLDRGDELLGGRFALVAASVVRGNLAALAPGAIGELAGEEGRRVAALASGAAGPVGASDEVLPWDEIAPEIRDLLVVFQAAPVMMVLIIFLAVSIGIVNTLLMATFERIKELGLMKALGLRPGRIVAMVLAESALLAVVGVAAGMVVGLAVATWWSRSGLDLSLFMSGEGGFNLAGVSFDPVLRPRLGGGDLLKTAIPVVIMTTLAGLWPAVKAARLQVTQALGHE